MTYYLWLHNCIHIYLIWQTLIRANVRKGGKAFGSYVLAQRCVTTSVTLTQSDKVNEEKEKCKLNWDFHVEWISFFLYFTQNSFTIILEKREKHKLWFTMGAWPIDWDLSWLVWSKLSREAAAAAMTQCTMKLRCEPQRNKKQGDANILIVLFQCQVQLLTVLS